MTSPLFIEYALTIISQFFQKINYARKNHTACLQIAVERAIINLCKKLY